MTERLSGGSNDYYRVWVSRPTSGGDAYSAECNDIIEALGMNYAEGNAFKAIWRHAALRKGGGKPGSTLLYEAEKAEFFAKRLVAQAGGVSSDSMVLQQHQDLRSVPEEVLPPQGCEGR